MNLLGQHIECKCGKTHGVAIKEVVVEAGVLSRFHELLRQHHLGSSTLLVADENTWEIAGRQAADGLRSIHVGVTELIYQRPKELVPDEMALGELMIKLASQPDFLVGVGSGTITDLTRFAATIAGVPFVVIPTAPSMDGYASGVSAMINHGIKETFSGNMAQAIYADVDILAQAPAHMIQAGFGDLLGKLTAKADWILSREHLGEYYCQYVQDLIDSAIRICLDDPEGCVERSPDYIKQLLDALVLSGITIGMVGNSRPASGSEHHLAHYWEMQALKEDRAVPLHGQKVGVATTIMAVFYQQVQKRVEESGVREWQTLLQQVAPHIPSPADCQRLLQRAGAIHSYQELGIPTDWVHTALLEAMWVRDRFTVLRFANERGWLTDVAADVIAQLG